MARTRIEDAKARRKGAQSERDTFQPLLDDIHDFLIPTRRSNKTGSKGDSRVDKIFDPTPYMAAYRFAGKLHEDLWATGEENFRLEVGPVLKARAALDEGVKAEVEALEPILANISKVAGSAFLDGTWDQALSEACWDLIGGTGPILAQPGGDDQFVRFTSVPIDEILLESNGYGDKSAVFWTRKWSLRAIEDAWGRDGFSTDLLKKLEEAPETEIDLNQDCLWDAKAKRWIFIVWSKDNDDKAFTKEEETRTCPWIIAEYFRLPGETYARGLGNLAMPGVKTLNTAVQLSLQSGAIALLGIYTAVDDGVFNPDTARIEPGVFWKVARNGGTMGPSVQRFQDPRVDLQNIILNEYRSTVQSSLMDEALPPLSGAVRSPTEILERVKRLAQDHQGAFGRLITGVVLQAVRRVIEIGYDKKYFEFAPPIDQLLVKVQVTSPMALARMAAKVQRITQWVEIVEAMMPGKSDLVVEKVDAAVAVGKALGVDAELFTHPDKRKALQDRYDQLAMAAAAAHALGQGAAAGAADPFSSQNAAPPPETAA